MSQMNQSDELNMYTMYTNLYSSNSSRWFDKNTHPQLKLPHVEKNYENKTANESK